MSSKTKYFIVGQHCRDGYLFLQMLSDKSLAPCFNIDNAFRFVASDFNDSLLAYIADHGYSIFQVGRNI